MIVHIVMLNVRDEADGKNKEQNTTRLVNELEALPSKIDGILKYEVGLNVKPSKAAFDLVINSEFNSLEDLAAYSTHPEHLKIVDLVGLVCSERAVVDYEK